MYPRKVFFYTILLVCVEKLCAYLVNFCRREFFQYCETESCDLSAVVVASVSRFLGAFCELSAKSQKLGVKKDEELYCEAVPFC